MIELHNLTITQSTSYLVDKIAEERGITKKLARQLLSNAILYNVVIEEINLQIDFLTGEYAE